MWGLISVASGASVWRGYDYCRNNKIINYKTLSEREYEGKVCGSNKKEYNVFINIEHPRKSKCDCPHAKDKHIICKHIVALYFSIFPKELEKFLKEVEEYEKEEEHKQNELDKKVIKYINSLSKEELKQALFELLYDSQEWQFNRFIRDRIDY